MWDSLPQGWARSDRNLIAPSKALIIGKEVSFRVPREEGPTISVVWPLGPGYIFLSVIAHTGCDDGCSGGEYTRKGIDSDSDRETSSSSRQEVEQAERSGRTAPLPSPRGPCQGDGSLAAGAARYEVKNSTAYDLRVILDGPVVQEIRVAPNSVQAVTFPMGAYKILGRVASPNVLPFFGQQAFAAGLACATEFYINSKP